MVTDTGTLTRFLRGLSGPSVLVTELPGAPDQVPVALNHVANSIC